MEKKAKGLSGEQKVAALLARLDTRDYRVSRDLIVSARGGTTEIDHVAVSRFGIFVVETKTFSGTVFGLPNDPYWHQLIGRSRLPFQNPIHQNSRHIDALMMQLGLPRTDFISIVAFVGTEFGWPPPEGVTGLVGLLPFIRRHSDPLLTPVEVEALAVKLQALRNSGLSMHEHLRSLRVRLLWERILAPSRHRYGPDQYSSHLAPTSRAHSGQPGFGMPQAKSFAFA